MIEADKLKSKGDWNMIEADKLKSKVEALKMKYSSNWVTHPQGDSFYGFHGFMDMMLSEAIKYGFEQGESFGKYEKYAEKVVAECLIQPENDRAWKEQLEEIKKDTNTHDLIKQTELLELIVEILLVRKNGG